MKFCPQCGNALSPGIRFCESCGYDLLLPADAPVAGVSHGSPGANADQPVIPPPTAGVRDLPPLHNAVEQPKEKKKNKGLIIGILAVIIILAGGGWFGYQYYLNTGNEPAQLADSTLMIDESTILDTVASGGPLPVVDTASQYVVETSDPSPVPESKQNKTATVKPGSQKKPSTDTKKTSASKKEKEPSVKPAVQVKAEPMVKKPVSIVFSSTNKEFPKYRNPKNPTRFSVTKKMMITRIVTDHYNQGNGTEAVGSITVKDKGGTVTGTWKAMGKPGSSGTVNGKWVCEPNIVFEPGVYLIHDSDPSSWSKNFFGTGFVEVEGYEVE